MSRLPYSPPTIVPQTHGYFDKHGSGREGRSCRTIEGVSVSELADKFGSPLFVYSERLLRRQIRDARRAFESRYPRVRFAWSYKTNYLQAVCSIFHQEGAIAEVVSDFEYEKARALGVDGRDIIYNGPYKTPESLARAVSEGALIQIDNRTEIETLQRIASELGQTARVGLRVNLETGPEPVWSKFGFALENGDALSALARIAECDALRMTGLHAHVGTFILDPSRYSTSIQKLTALAFQAVRRFGMRIEYLNAGGGFASKSTLHHQYLPGADVAPRFDDYADAISEAIYTNWPASEPQPMLYLESGRALCDEAGSLISTVLDARHGRDGSREMIVDAGVNLLYTAAWYRFDITPEHPSRDPEEPTRVYGPLCMNIDEVRRSAPLPPMRAGDRLVISPVGAYNLTQSMQFITYRPAVVLIGENGDVDVIRHRETLDAVERLEELPARLRRTEQEDA